MTIEDVKESLRKLGWGLDDSRLEVDALSNKSASENLSDKDWSRERKKQVEGQYKTKQQRISIDKTKPVKK